MKCCWLAALILLTCAWAAAAPGLRVGFGTNKPPYVFEATQSGLEVDIVAAASRLAGFEIKPTFAPMERLHVMYAAGQLDAIATTNPQAGEKGFFSQPYVTYHNMAAALTARRYTIRSIADLAGYSVSAFQRAHVLLGPAFRRMAEENPSYREEAQQVVRNLLLLSGRVDVIVGDRRIINYFMRDIPAQVDIRQAITWYEIFPATEYQMVFRNQEQRDRFDTGLAAMRKRGDYQLVEKKYQDF
ncbi:ABC transporter arginine-binding protein 1 [Andreprevotia sp. IGB-42]|uniref:substrate-binding periplasmic protein n=1 Tax=Andreprevotia sp. IGB-42 TaxID=2497473 RepID=UPI0013572B97|nr:transporter substrate-binding domain-containing protein [Andreprevotia sp. IGB-42]KAF0814434.1 ABC transporter arginine-binding protein 1 [Andreprevotia sp. IGB-42]